MNVKDKVVVVTGASSGIGQATARLLSEKGAKVVLAARSIKKLENLAKTLPQSLAVKTDVTKKLELKNLVQKTLKQFGRIDILINNAGRGYDAKFEQIDLKKMHYLIELNLIGPISLMQQAIPIMKKQGHGLIINISSGTSLMNIPGISAYSSLKRALNGLTLTAREELKSFNIKVCLVYPYITSSNFYKNKLSGQPDPKSKAMYEEGDTPIQAAEKILEAIETEQAETFARDFMEK